MRSIEQMDELPPYFNISPDGARADLPPGLSLTVNSSTLFAVISFLVFFR